MKKDEGFTLVELLVVIAIIGIMAAIVTANFTSTRDNTSNTSIKVNLATVRSQTEIYYINNDSNYGSFTYGACPATSGSGHVFLNPTIVGAIAEAKKNSGGEANCWANTNQWSVIVSLRAPEGANNYWCVDSTAAGRGVATLPSSGSVCP